MTGPATDADVPAYWRGLGLPGLIDIHVHFLPPAMLAKVWAYFDRAAEHYGQTWPITYRTGDAERLATLRELGVRAFPALSYPHRPGMARWLNEWAADFAGQHPDCLRSATFFPEPDAADYVSAAIDGGTRIFKSHLEVGGYDPRDPLLDDVWGRIADAGIPVVVHSGSGPGRPGPFTGPGPIGAVLARHPRLTLVVAHLGMPEYAGHLELVDRHPNVYVDTTMVATDFAALVAPLPSDIPRRLAERADRVLFGTDFPNIPYAYAHQLEALDRLDLGVDWLRGVLWGNGARLLGVPPA